ncbi:hypothetical protein LR48_Vigan151s000900 [Vigna angularis]|uniref:Uncharacterized protein n=1 Tax=Phaseolus angularis TaxID=3914 RepID=A0A0L9T4Y9_PHAAN|nr:hypothetical protein LR48_Vigan151s000900 [Vigna angularis]
MVCTVQAAGRLIKEGAGEGVWRMRWKLHGEEKKHTDIEKSWCARKKFSFSWMRRYTEKGRELGRVGAATCHLFLERTCIALLVGQLQAASVKR